MKKVIVLILVTALLLLPLPAYAAQSGEVSLTAHLYNDKDSTAVRCRFYDAERQIPYIHVLDFLTCIYKGEFTLRRIGKSMWQVRNGRRDKARGEIYPRRHQRLRKKRQGRGLRLRRLRHRPESGGRRGISAARDAERPVRADLPRGAVHRRRGIFHRRDAARIL